MGKDVGPLNPVLCLQENWLNLEAEFWTLAPDEEEGFVLHLNYFWQLNDRGLFFGLVLKDWMPVHVR